MIIRVNWVFVSHLVLDVHSKVVWMQLGISNEEAERKSKEKWYRC
jgi:predicted CoA-binding protein